MTPTRQAKARPRKKARAGHYGIERWVDFARGLESEPESTEMSDHAAGCSTCHDLMTFCMKLYVTARFLSMSTPTPPFPKRQDKHRG
ncbi:MAG: hypothetical protein JWP63_5411 [Candidatus Solibacter sp.]|nr:hypothetical protein [Candidatus Solibacter sp.]